ncbi:alpha/beta fold hydrolase [Agromyces sp. NPDC049794]|uniref:alpha/beta hydrolase n=1 Tax=unclassified Agromyces TaxID=2639701 RepID=UPI0033FF442F
MRPHLQDIAFDVGGTRCAGVLFLPEHAEHAERALPAVVLAHGFSGTMDRLLDVAAGFAEGGFAALLFDYRSFGASGGEPRQVVDVNDQLEDFSAAVAVARAHPRIDADRVAVWGNSLGGAHAVVLAARDSRIAAVIAQIPFNGFPKEVEGRSAKDAWRLMGAMLSDGLRGVLRLPPKLIPMVGAPGTVAVTAVPDAQRHLELLRGESTTWRNEVAPRGLLEMMWYRPEKFAPLVQSPLLVCIAADDRVTPEEMTRPIAERAPRGELKRYSGGHFDFYNAPHIRRQVMADQLEFLRRHLVPAGAREEPA